MAKKKEPQVVHPPTKRQLTHWQKQALRQRIIAITGIVTILAVIAVIVVPGYFKWYVPDIKPMHETTVEVNGHKFSMAYYVDALKYWEAVYENMYSSGGQTFYQYITDSVEQNIEQNEIMKEASVKLGITVSDDAVNQYIKNNSLGNNLAVRDIIRGQLLSQKLTSDYFGPQVPTAGEQRDVLAMFLESQSQLDDIKAQINAGADFGQLAADNSLESTTQSDKGALGSHSKGVFDYLLSTTGLDDAIFAQQVSIWGDFHDADTAKQVGYWLVKVTERNSDNSQVHVSGMLLSSLEEAQSIKSQLDAGADFTTLAQQYSQKWSDTSKDDLGWITTSSTDAYKSYVFDTTIAVGTISTPIKDTSQSTKGGYWLFKVMSSTTGDISSVDKTDLTNKAFNTWLTALQTEAQNNNQLINSLDQTKKDFATAQAKS